MVSAWHKSEMFECLFFLPKETIPDKKARGKDLLCNDQIISCYQRKRFGLLSKRTVWPVKVKRSFCINISSCVRYQNNH